MQASRMFDRRKQNSILRCCGKIREQKGQALIETALAMPLLLLFLVGAIEIARAVFAGIEVSNAAHAGVQYGAQSSAAAGDTTGIQNAATADAPDITLGTTTVSHSCICSNGAASTCLATDCTGANIETILTVQTQATFDPGIYLPGMSHTFTLQGQAIQKVLQ